MQHPAELTEEEISHAIYKGAAVGVYDKKIAAAATRKALWFAGTQMRELDAMEFRQGLRAAGIEPWVTPSPSASAES